MSNKLQNAISADMPLEHIIALASEGGMKTLLAAGLEAVSRGDTSFEEVQRVVGLGDG